MRKYISVLAALAVLFACEPENNPGGANVNEKEGEKENGGKEEEVVTIPEGAIDLGIVITRGDGTTYNLYWATSNLCEDGLCPNPEDYGDYYAWGETEPHYVKGHSQDWPCNDWRVIDGKTMTGYNWPSYKWCNGNYNKLTKYCPASETGLWNGTGAPDNKTVLETGPQGDDAASKILGGKWRIPTDEEWTELLDKCTWTWTDSYNETGVGGMIVTSKVSGFTDKSIFLPAAGDRSQISLFFAGSNGSYRSSSIYLESPDQAWYVCFQSSYVDRFFNGRYGGLSVRPVSE